MKRTTVKKGKEAIIKAGQNAYRDRRRKKRDFRSLWSVRISAAAKLNGTSYSRLIHALTVSKIALDRKSLSELAIQHPEVFTAVVKESAAK